MWALGTHENLLWLLLLSAPCATGGFGRGINSSSSSAAEEPSLTQAANMHIFRMNYQKTQEHAQGEGKLPRKASQVFSVSNCPKGFHRC